MPCRCLCCWRRLQLYSQPLLGSRTMKCLGSAPRALTRLPHWNPQQPVKCTGEFVSFTPWSSCPAGTCHDGHWGSPSKHLCLQTKDSHTQRPPTLRVSASLGSGTTLCTSGQPSAHTLSSPALQVPAFLGDIEDPQAALLGCAVCGVTLVAYCVAQVLYPEMQKKRMEKARRHRWAVGVRAWDGRRGSARACGNWGRLSIGMVVSTDGLGTVEAQLRCNVWVCLENLLLLKSDLQTDIQK